MSKAAGSLSGGRQLARLLRENASVGTLLQKIITGINTVADNTASSAVGRLSPPPPINGVTVKQSGEMLHIQINHSGTIQQGIHYFSEIATDPSFAQPLVVHHGTSRTATPVHLPTYDDSGNKQTYYLRSYAQYPGSNPTTPIMYGSPTAITMNGSTKMTLLNSTGSGTAANTGQQPGWGFGKVQRRSQ